MPTREVTSASDLRHLLVTSPVRVAKPPKMGESLPPEWIDAAAKWDTGAVVCAISRSICSRLQLAPTQQAYAASISGAEKVLQDLILLDLCVDGTFIPTLAIILDEMPGADCDMLIGMNVISLGDFSLSTDRSSNQIRMSFKPYPGTLKSFK